MDALIEAINLEIDRTKRKAMWDRLQEIYAEEVPVIGLYWRSNPHILPKWLKGLRPTGQMAPSTLWVEDWRSEEHTSELQSLMRISYAVFRLLTKQTIWLLAHSNVIYNDYRNHLTS